MHSKYAYNTYTMHSLSVFLVFGARLVSKFSYHGKTHCEMQLKCFYKHSFSNISHGAVKQFLLCWLWRRTFPFRGSRPCTLLLWRLWWGSCTTATPGSWRWWLLRTWCSSRWLCWWFCCWGRLGCRRASTATSHSLLRWGRGFGFRCWSTRTTRHPYDCCKSKTIISISTIWRLWNVGLLRPPIHFDWLTVIKKTG